MLKLPLNFNQLTYCAVKGVVNGNIGKVILLLFKTLNTNEATRLWTRLYRSTSTRQPPSQRTDTVLVGYATAHPTVRSYRLRETFF